MNYSGSIILSVIFPILLLRWSINDYVYISKMVFSGNVVHNFIEFSYRYLVAFAGISLMFLLGNSIKKSSKLTSFFQTIGNYSIDIYAIQTIFVTLLSYLPLVENTLLFNIVYVPVVSLIIASLSILISKNIIRKTKFLNKILLGGR